MAGERNSHVRRPTKPGVSRRLVHAPISKARRWCISIYDAVDNRHGRFRDSDILRKVFEKVVCGYMAAGLVSGEGFAVDASVTKDCQRLLDRRVPDSSRDYCTVLPIEH